MIKNIKWIQVVLVAAASLSIADTAPDMKEMVQNNFVETAQNGVKLSL
jgi:hypothetical protein